MRSTWRQAVLQAPAVAFLLAGCGSNAPAVSPTNAAPAATFDALVQAASKEGKVVIWGMYPSETDVARVQQAFNQRFSTSIQLQLVPLAAPDAHTRIAAEAQAGRYEVDVMPQAGSESLPLLTERKLLAQVDWLGLFGKDLPDVKDAAEAAFPEFRGYAVGFYDSAYVLAYNTKQGSEVPHRWADLADSKYKGQLVIATQGVPFNYLALHPDWGADRTETLVRGLAANQPRLEGSSPRVIDAVGRGERRLGIAGISVILDAKAAGQPVELAVPDYVPLDRRLSLVAEKAPHPNAARLYTAWEVSEGINLFGQLRHLARVTQPDSLLSATIKQQSPEAKLVAAKTIADVALSAEFLKKAGDILTTAR